MNNYRNQKQNLMTSLSSQQFYDTEDQTKKLKTILDAQEKV
jgi:hypothetical protein